MPPIPHATFTRLLKRLTPSEFEAFVVDLWTARGWSVTRAERGAFRVTRGGESRRLAVVAGHRWWPPGLAVAPSADADVVVVRRTPARLSARARTAEGTLLDGGDLYWMALYAIPVEARERLLRRHFGREPTVPLPTTARMAAGVRTRLTERSRVYVGVLAVVVILAAVFAAAGQGGLPADSTTAGNQTATGAGGGESGLDATPNASRTARPALTPAARVALAGVGWGPSAWPTAGASPTRTGHVQTAGPQEDATALAIYDVSGPVTTALVVVNGTVFVGTGDGRLFGLNASGTDRWQVELGERVESAPAISGGTVFVGSAVPMTATRDPDWRWETGRFAALDADTGDRRWTGTVGSVDAAAPAVADGVVFVGSADSHVYALDADTGETRWRTPTGGRITSSLAVADGTVFVGSADGNVYAFDAETGTERWRVTTGSRVEATPVVSNGTVFVGSGNGRTYALDADTGAERWNFLSNEPVVASTAVANGTVFVGTVEGRVFALDADTGARRWMFGIGEPVVAPPVIAGTTVYVGSADGGVYALDAEQGLRQWRYRVDGGIRVEPAVVDGILFVGTTEGHVYALGERPPGPTPPIGELP